MGECDRKAGMMQRWPFNIVILTGAGISAESGLSTFRDEAGSNGAKTLLLNLEPLSFQLTSLRLDWGR